MPSRRSSPTFWVAALVLAAILVPTTLAASRDHHSYSTRNSVNDRRAPKPVDDLRVAAADTASVSLDWSRTWDNVGVEGYGVYLDGARTAQTPYSRYTLQDLACGKGYTVGVDAFDDAGNRSRSTSTFVSTAACRDVTPPTAPTGVQSAATTGTSVILSWAPSSDDFGVVGYGIYVGGFWVGRWSDPSATITNLSCGQDYEIGIDAVDAAGNQSTRTTAFFSTAPCADHKAPTSPGGLAVTKATQNTVSLGWTASTDASGIAEYGLYLDGKKVGTTSTTSGDVAGLACGATHTFGVDAADKAQNRSAVASLTAASAPCSTPPPPSSPPPPPSDPSVPSAPPNLHSTSVTQTAVSLGWDSSTAADGMEGYQIFRDGTKIGEGPGVHGGFTNTWTDTGRSCGTSYQYAVAGVDKSGHVGPKSTLSVPTAPCTTQTPPPPPPSSPPPPPATDSQAPTQPGGVTASTRTATSIALTWQPSNDDVGVAGYGLYRGGSRVSTTTSTTSIFSGLACGTSYTLAVDASDAAGNRSQQAVVMVSTTACADTQAPTAPTSLATSNVTQTGAMLTWAAARDNVGVTGYDVSRNGTKVGTVTALSSAQSGLTCNTQYTFAVVARDAAGNSSTQAQVSVTTAACSAPAPPPPPPPPPPSTSQAGVVQLSGTVSPSQLMDAVNAQPSGSVTVQPASGASSFSVSGSLSINRPSLTIKGANVSGEVTFSSGASGSALVDSSAQGFSIKGADNVRIENNTLDGQGRIANNIIWDEPAGNTPDGFVIRGNTLRNYYIDGGDVHSEALYVGYSTNGLIENNSFTNNGNTSHIFFTWFGNTANPSTSYPRNMCVRGNTFGPTHGAYYDVNLRGEIPTSANIKVQRDATLAIPSFYGDC